MHRIVLVRHGRTAENALEIFQGQRGSGLDEVGRAQAERLANRLMGQRFARLVSSDLQRAVETARLLGAAVSLEVEQDPALREVDVGAWTGLPFAEVERRFPEEWAAWRAGLDLPRGGGETYADLAARMHAAVESLTADMTGDLLVVSHGAALRAFTARLIGLPPQGSPSLSGMGNTGMNTVACTPRGLRLVSYNDTAHLEGAA